MWKIGNDLEMGVDASTRKMLSLSKDERDKHLYVCGATGTGKSKLLEYLIRQDIVNWRRSKCGVLVVDPHGKLFDDLMAWLSWYKIDRPIIPIDLRRSDSVVSYNVLRQRASADPAVVINNFVQAMAHVWGESGTDKTPLFERWATNILRALYDKRLTLLEAEHLIDCSARDLRKFITKDLSHRGIARDWLFANTLSPKDFEQQISSTINRLRAFLSTEIMRHVFGQNQYSLDLSEALKEGHLIIACIASEKERISEEDGSLFATLLLSDLWSAARERGKSDKLKPFYVYLDEFQNFITPTIAKNLDQARGFGLHLTLCHQFPLQLLHTGAHGPQVNDSVMVNARNKAVFAIEGEDNLKPLAQSLFMGTMSPDKIKHELFSTKVMDYVEETRTVQTSGRSSSSTVGAAGGAATGVGEGGGQLFHKDEIDDEDKILTSSVSKNTFGQESSSTSESEAESESESQSIVPFLKPIIGQEKSSVQFEPLEEQMFRCMATLFDQEQRRFVVRSVGSKIPSSVSAPVLEPLPKCPELTEQYLTRVREKWPFIISRVQAIENLEARERDLLAEMSTSQVDEPQNVRRRI